MTNAHRLTIDEILQRFFVEQRAGTKGLTLARVELIERRLRECVEGEAERILVPADLQILAAEREFESANAVARTMQLPRDARRQKRIDAARQRYQGHPLDF